MFNGLFKTLFKLFILLTVFNESFAYERSDAFIVRAQPTFYKVLSPVKVSKKVGLIVQNKTLNKIIGKLWSENSGDIEIVTIESGKSRSIEFQFNKKDEFYFIPLSPPFQRVRLKTGEKSYEVPAQRQD